MSFTVSWGWQPSTLKPLHGVLPRIFLMVSEHSLARDQCHTCWAIPTISSKVMFPLCLMFFCFFIFLSGSLRALMIRAEAEGTISIQACLFWIISFTVILRPFQSPVALAMLSHTFFGDRPRGPVLGTGADVVPNSSLVHLGCVTLISLGSNLGGMVEAAGVGRTRIWDDKVALLPPPSRKRFCVFSPPLLNLFSFC